MKARTGAQAWGVAAVAGLAAAWGLQRWGERWGAGETMLAGALVGGALLGGAYCLQAGRSRRRAWRERPDPDR